MIRADAGHSYRIQSPSRAAMRFLHARHAGHGLRYSFADHEIDRDRIRTELGGNFCRCTGYLPIIRAIEDVYAQRARSAGSKPVVQAAGWTREIIEKGDQRERTHKQSIAGKSSPPEQAHLAPVFCRAPH